jgi:cell division protein FtsA
MESEIIVGLDIGTTKIACIVGSKNEYGKFEILGYGKTESIGVKRGVVANIENTVQSIRKAVKQAEEKSGVAIKYVNVGIAGQHIKSHQHRGNIIREDDDKEISKEEIELLTQNMYKLSMTPGEEIIDVIAQDYIIDNENGITEPVGMLGNTLEANFHIIIGQTTSAKNIYKCIKKSDLEMVNLILEPIASAEAVLSEEEKEAGVVLVDIGGGTTDIAIFQDSIIRHSAVIPFGGDVVTEDVKEGCKIMKKHAEELKVKFGSALASENREDEVVAIPGLRGRPPKEITLQNLASIIQARMEEIVGQIYFEIKNSGFEKKLIAGIVLTGGGAQLKHIDQLTEFATGMPTRIGYPNEHLAVGVIDEMASPMFATGVGLVIEGVSRFDYEKDKEKRTSFNKESEESVLDNETNKQQKNRKEITGESGPSKFLKGLRDWFENDTSE